MARSYITEEQVKDEDFLSEAEHVAYQHSFTELSDTPNTYSGTEGLYLRATASGTEWAIVSGGVGTFLELTDTPSTYSGTEGAMLVSTGSGTELTHDGVWLSGEGVPGNSLGSMGNYYIDEDTSIIYKKNTAASGTVYTAKSIVLDIATNHGDGSYIEFRQMDFYKDGSKLLLTEANHYTAYGTYYAATLETWRAFDTGTSKTGIENNNGWVHTGASNQRCTVVFDDPIDFDEIRINNGHHSGTMTSRGINAIELIISSDSITSLVYGEAVSNSTVIYDGVFDEHVASDVEDEQTVFSAGSAMSWGVIVNSVSNASFLDLSDTPTTYSGAEGQYLRATASGTEWATVSGITDHGGLTGLSDNDHPQYLLTTNFSTYSGTLQTQIDGKSGTGHSHTLLNLTDTPSSYDTGKYLVSTASGTEWGAIAGGVETLLELTDTPSTYSGTSGAILISTGSGTEFTQEGRWLSGEGAPPGSLGADTNMYLDILNDAVYYRIPSTILDEYNTNIALTGTASADSVYNGGDVRFVASKANDDDPTGSRWLSDTGAPHWWQVDWTEVKYVSRIGFIASIAAAAEHFSEYYIEYWADGEWNESAHVTGYTDQRPTVTYHDIGENTDKIRIRTLSGNNNHGIYEFYAYGGVATVGGWEEIGTFIDSTSFLDLTDTPSTYSGTEGMYLRSTGSATEWATVSGIELLTDLTDTPSVYDTGKYLKSTASGTEWATVSGVEVLTDLTDTPSTYDDGKYLKSTASGTEWDSGTQTLLDLTDTPSTYIGTLNQYLMSNGSRSTWATISGIGLVLADNGVPANDIGSPGDFYIDKDTETIYEKIQTISGSVVYSDNLSVSGTNAFSLSEYTTRIDDRAFDGTVGGYSTTSWNSGSEEQNYIGYYFPVAKAINKIRMASPTSSYNRTPVAFKLMASNSEPTNITQAEGGTLIYEVKMEGTFDYSEQKTSVTSHWAGEEWKAWEFTSNTTEYNYYWFLIWDKDETANRTAQYMVSEIEMMSIASPITYIEYWVQALSTTKELLELNDTPTTYSGTTDAMLVSTGSGIEFTYEGVWLGGSGAPSGASGNIGNYYIDEDTSTIYKKNRVSSPVINPITSRSIIVDVTDHWGGSYVGIKEVYFHLDDSPVTNIETTDFVAYSSHDYPSSWEDAWPFDTSFGGSWMASVGTQRLICVFNSNTNFDEITITNFQNGVTNRGVKNVKIYSSTDSITDTTYDASITNSTLLFDGQITQGVYDQVIDISEAMTTYSDTGWDQITPASEPGSLLELSDTPTTYSGAEGQYLRATASGTEWATISGIETFLGLTDTPSSYDDGKYLISTVSGTEWSTVSGIETLTGLTDTPSTYSGTSTAMLVSTGSGTDFTYEGRWYIDEGAPDELVGSYDSLYIDSDTNDVYSYVNNPAVSGTESPEDETVLLLHMEGSDGQNNFYDDGTGANCPHTMNVLNLVTTETEQKKFGTSSAYYITKHSHRLYTADASSDFNFGTGAFSIDFFVRFSTGSYVQYLFTIGYNLLSLRLANNVLYVYPLGISYSWAPDTSWHHLAFEADGSNNQYLYLDGLVVDSSSSGASLGGTDVISIGNSTGVGTYSLINGYIDEFRVVKGAQSGNGTTFPVPEAQYNAGYVAGSSGWEKIGSLAESSVVNVFLDLVDTPTTYSGSGGKYVTIKEDETGLEFTTAGDWTTVSSNYDASNAENIFINSTASGIVIALPDNPIIGHNVSFVDAVGNCGTNNVTVSGGSTKILGLSENFIIDYDYARFTLTYYDTTNGWVLGLVGHI